MSTTMKERWNAASLDEGESGISRDVRADGAAAVMPVSVLSVVLLDVGSLKASPPSGFEIVRRIVGGRRHLAAEENPDVSERTFLGAAGRLVLEQEQERQEPADLLLPR